jgi:CheY-like chemotaxis protein
MSWTAPCVFLSSRMMPLFANFIVEALRVEGVHVIHAADGEQALGWCGRRAVDVLVTDIRLPGEIDGWEIAERCRKHHPDLPVIYSVGHRPVCKQYDLEQTVSPGRDSASHEANDRTAERMSRRPNDLPEGRGRSAENRRNRVKQVAGL